MNKKAQGSTIKFIVFLIVLVVIFMVGSRLMQNFLSPRTDLILDINEGLKQTIMSSISDEQNFNMYNTEETSTGGAVEYYYVIRNPRDIPSRFYISIKEINNKINSNDLLYYKGPIKVKANELSVNKIVIPALDFSENTYTFKINIEMEESIGVRKEFIEPQTIILHTTQ